MNTPATTQVPAQTLLAQLGRLVGTRHVLTDESQTRRYRKGYRTGEGRVLAVVTPGTLLEQWQVLQAVVEAGRIVIMQAANTGLTGGSTPDGDGYDRDVVLISTRRLTGIQLIREGEESKKFCFFAIGVNNANMEFLKSISVREPLKLQGLMFKEFFVWLSGSLGNVSSSIPGTAVPLLPPSSWSAGWQSV